MEATDKDFKAYGGSPDPGGYWGRIGAGMVLAAGLVGCVLVLVGCGVSVEKNVNLYMDGATFPESVTVSGAGGESDAGSDPSTARADRAHANNLRGLITVNYHSESATDAESAVDQGLKANAALSGQAAELTDSSSSTETGATTGDDTESGGEDG